MSASEVIERYWELVDIARQIVTAEPFNRYVNGEEMQIRFSNTEGMASFGDAQAIGGGDCDSAEIEVNWIDFPLALLDLSTDELAAWQAKALAKKQEAEAMAKAKKAAASQVARERLKIIQEQRDRSTYERLKAKYEGQK